jgi:hypothetical protein
VRAVVGDDWCRIRHLVGVAPPQAHRERLHFSLEVVPEEQLRVVADAHVHAAQRLVVVLAERNVLDVVVAIGLRRVDVGQRQQFEQNLAIGVDLAGRHDAAVAGERLVSVRAQAGKVRRVTEVAVAHGLGRHPRLQSAGVEVLLVVLVAEEEEHLVAALVEVRARDQQRTADVEAGEVELVLGLVLRAGVSVVDLVEEPLVRVPAEVARVEIRGPAKVSPAGLGHHVDGRRALGVFGAEVGLEDLELLHHVRIGVHRGRAVAARVGPVRAVDDDVERVALRAVARVVAQRALLAALAVAVDADDLAVEPRRAVAAAKRHHAGQDLQKLGGASADDGEVLNLLAGDGRALLTRRDRRQLGDGGDSDLLGDTRHAQLERCEVADLAQAHDDALGLDGLETAQLGLHRVGAGLNGGKHEVARVVAHRRALVARQLVDERDGDAGQHGVAAVDDGAAQLAGQGLSTCGCGHRQDQENDKNCGNQRTDAGMNSHRGT